jgi:hypothetical protein
VRGAEVVVADGRILPASEAEEFLAPKDWRRSRHCRQYRLDEAVSEVGEDDTAFGGGRSPRYSVNLAASCTTPEELPAEREWVPSLFDALRPHRSELS